MCKFIFFINNIVAINFTMRCLLIVENWIGIVANLCFIIIVDVCSLKDEMPSSLRNGPNQAISHVGAMARLYYLCKLYSSEIQQTTTSCHVTRFPMPNVQHLERIVHA